MEGYLYFIPLGAVVLIALSAAAISIVFRKRHRTHIGTSYEDHDMVSASFKSAAGELGISVEEETGLPFNVITGSINGYRVKINSWPNDECFSVRFSIGYNDAP
ncbi:MAG: hypothetical protein JW969_04865 [Spirochaetales bacterium]|nr:hypothetical protein [Spirochaetales bacterium]